jgi:gliding motility-associated-like protein
MNPKSVIINMPLKVRIIFSITLFIAGFCQFSFAQLALTSAQQSGNWADYYVQEVLLGTGVEAFNVTFTGCDTTGGNEGLDSLQIGEFTSQNTLIDLPYGLMLHTGSVEDFSGGANFSDGVSDIDLDSLLPGFTMNNAAILEFDFVPKGDTVRFNYVFGSLEYPTYVCSQFNDVFGFFLSGPGINGNFENNGENIALVPGTNIPVSINTINDVAGSSSCTQPCPCNSQYYINNNGFANDTNVRFTGMTVNLEAKHWVNCGDTYHIKLAIADAGDGVLNSGVFLEGGSFTSNLIEVNIGSVNGDSTINEGCGSAEILFTRGDTTDTSITYIQFLGTATNGVDCDTIPDTIVLLPGVFGTSIVISPYFDNIPEGVEYLTIQAVSVTLCNDTFISEGTLYFHDIPDLNLSTTEDTTIDCQTDSLTISSFVQGGGPPPYTYVWNTGDTGSVITVPISSGPGIDTFAIEVWDSCALFSNYDTVFVTVLDTMPPLLITSNLVIHLNSNGQVSIANDSADAGTSDNCLLDSIWLSQTNYGCADVGVNTETFFAKDLSGNVDSTSISVTVQDTIAPVAIAQSLALSLDSFGSRIITALDIDNGSWDSCGITTYQIDTDTFDCSDVGTSTTITLSITDVNGNVSTDTSTVTITDDIAPEVITQDITVYLDGSGSASITTGLVDNGTWDSCGLSTLTLDNSNFDCSDVGSNVVTLTATDVNGNSESATATVTVVDSIAPITYSFDTIVVYLNDSGFITIEPADIDSGSWDSCGIAGRVLSDSLFTCSDVGLFPSTTISVTDVYGNTGTSTTIVDVIDTVRPVAHPFDTNTFYLDANGQLTISGVDLDSASYDSCGISSYISVTINFNCGNVGAPINALMKVVDVSGNEDSATTVIIILDTVSPIAIAQNISVYLDTSGQVSITPAMVNNGSNDSCGIDTMFIDTANFSCANTVAPVSVTLTIEDVNGNTSSDIALVTVIDTVAPVVSTHDTTLYLDVNGQVLLDTSYINDISTDNCLIDTMTLSQNVFTCADAGQTLYITLTAFDGSGNTDTSGANVTILDTVRPEPIARDLDLYLDANGNASITASLIDSASYDSCGVDSIWLDIYDFNCGDVGDNDVEFFIRDVNQNSDSVIVTVSVFDTVSPTALALPTYTVWLDNNGDASITRDSLNNGSYDSCGVTDYFLSDSLFDCSDLGAFPTITLTVVDVNGNSSTAQTVVTVLDTVTPSAQATNYTAYLNSGGAITIDSSNINNGSSDNCSIVTITLDTFQFDCSDVGQVNPVVMTVTDASGNVDTAHAFVTVLDTVAPVAIGQNITVYLDFTGNVSIDSSMVNNGSYDSCGIDSITLSDYAFDCGDVSAGQDIEMYVFDVNGNSDTVIVTITVEDTVAPQVFTLDSLTIALDSFGNYTLEANEIDSGSWDSCGIDTLILDQSIFGCNDIGSPILVTMTATDVNSNSTTGQTVVTVIDTIAPQVFSMSDTVYLDSSGLISISTLNVDSGSWDSCGIASYAIDTANFNCANTDTAVKVVLTVTDVHGNVSSDSSFVVIIDSIRPQIICQSDTVIANDSGQCGAVVSYSLPAVSDNCTVDTVFQSGDTTYQSGDEFPVGVTAVQFTVIDVNGNQDSCVFNVTVLDTQSPLILCQSDTLICDSIFIFDLPAVVENCPGDSIEQIAGLPSGSFYPVGITRNTFVSTDASGNTDTCSFEVTRIDYPSIAVAGQDTALCKAEDINLYAVDPVIGVGSWTSIGTGIIADTLDANSSVSQLSIGENQFVWTVRNDVCIPNSDTVLVSIDEQPTQIDLPADTSLCEEPEFSLVDESVAIGQAYWTWDGDATIIDSTSDTVLVSNLRIGTIQLFRTNENGVCIASIDTMLIHNNIVPTVDAGEDFGRFGGKKVTLSPLVIDGSTYSWTPADLFTDPNILEAEVVASQTTTLILTVTSDSGCVASDSLVYSLNGIDSIPTGITPNGDGVNDVWNIAGLSTYNDAEIYIFDQSGREVYFSKGYDTPWDGRMNGQLLPRASYYWIIDLNDGINEPLKGIISIIR